MQTKLTRKEQQQLLTLARKTIVNYVKHGQLEEIPFQDEGLTCKSGCFVTIKTHGNLRGCIGCFTAEKPLWQTVQEFAIAAASRDPRFYPLHQDELDDITIEISVLSSLKKIESIDEIQVGTHGLYIEKNMYRGVLLPQVATEYGWDRTTFLTQTCLKAGLESDAWISGADLYIFSAQIFGEK
ncbi:MAG: AmmeMemoRadiSam system protein A [Deltaproteobacteria bacterium]|nr:AmmeMemoRadiSam system protein A [Deltaproteobacteria bacterium]TLN01951.1 MAG: AmmeMemoRadiSam system protein A [bacterium]